MAGAKKLFTVLLIGGLLPIFITACWNNRALTDLGIAIAVGFDRTPGGEIVFTAQIVKPGVLRARQEGSEVEAFWTYSAGGETAFSAIRNMLTNLDRKAYFSHVQVIVIGEEMAREGIIDVLDIFERDQETNRKSYVLVTRGITAQQVLETPSDLEDIPGLQLKAIIDNSDALAKIKKLTLFDLLKCLNKTGFSPAIGVIQLHEKSRELKKFRDLEIKGSAVFQEDHLVGWLDSFATRGLLFALDEVGSGIINIQNPADREKLIAFELTGSSGKIGARLTEGSLVLTIEVKAEGRIGVHTGSGVSTASMLEKAGKEVEGIIKDNINESVRLAQEEYESDFFDFASRVHQTYPRYWREVSDDWARVFSKAPVEVKVSWQSTSSGLIKDPSKAK